MDEREIAKKGLDAPRITPEMVDEVIEAEAYCVFAGTTLTVCCRALTNGDHALPPVPERQWRLPQSVARDEN